MTTLSVLIVSVAVFLSVAVYSGTKYGSNYINSSEAIENKVTKNKTKGE